MIWCVLYIRMQKWSVRKCPLLLLLLYFRRFIFCACAKKAKISGFISDHKLLVTVDSASDGQFFLLGFWLFPEPILPHRKLPAPEKLFSPSRKNALTVEKQLWLPIVRPFISSWYGGYFWVAKKPMMAFYILCWYYWPCILIKERGKAKFGLFERLYFKFSTTISISRFAETYRAFSSPKKMGKSLLLEHEVPLHAQWGGPAKGRRRSTPIITYSSPATTAREKKAH